MESIITVCSWGWSLTIRKELAEVDSPKLARDQKVSLELDTLLSKYRDLFKEELGTVQDYQVKLHVHSGAFPKFCKARAVPYGLRESIENELERLELRRSLRR